MAHPALFWHYWPKLASRVAVGGERRQRQAVSLLTFHSTVLLGGRHKSSSLKRGLGMNENRVSG